MWEKIKAFFTNKVTQIVVWVIFGLCVIALIIGGINANALSTGLKLMVAIVTAVSAFISFIIASNKK